MIKSYKYKLKLNVTQKNKFERWLGVTRLIYNMAKEVSETTYKATKKGLSGYDLQKQVIEVKKDYDWMRELPKDTLVEPVFRYEKSMKRFFNKTSKYPNWAKKRKWKSLVFIQQNKTGLRIENGKIKLHKKIYLRYFNSRDLPEDAKIKRIIVKKEIDGWYASIQFQTELHQVKTANDNQVVGIDMGIARFATLSNGQYIDNPKVLEKYRRKLRIAQRALKHKKKGSNNQILNYQKIAKIHRKIARVRNDFQHKESTKLINQYGGFVVEKLKLSNMTKSAKGTAEKHGKNVKQKSGLNRSLLDVAMGSFLNKLEYKSSWNQRYFERVNPAYTSQACPECNYVSKENRKTQADFCCIKCGLVENSDVIGAINVLKRGGAHLL